MKKFAIPAVAILALTAMAIAFSSMSAPAPMKDTTPAIQSISAEAPKMDCCDKPTPAVIADEKDCNDCAEPKKDDCGDCAEKTAPQADAVSL